MPTTCLHQEVFCSNSTGLRLRWLCLISWHLKAEKSHTWGLKAQRLAQLGLKWLSPILIGKSKRLNLPNPKNFALKLEPQQFGYFAGADVKKSKQFQYLCVPTPKNNTHTKNMSQCISYEGHAGPRNCENAPDWYTNKYIEQHEIDPGFPASEIK